MVITGFLVITTICSRLDAALRRRIHALGLRIPPCQAAHRGPRRQGIAQLADGALEDGMAMLGSDLGQRFQYKAAPVHSRMWNGEGLRIHYGSAEQQDVD